MILLEQNTSRMPERYQRELIRGEHARAQLAVLRQRRIAEAAKQIEYRHIEGIGQRSLIPLDPEIATRLRIRHGVACLHDPDFLRSLWQKNPMLRAKCRADRVTLRMPGLRQNQRNAVAEGHGLRGDPASPFVGHETAKASVSLVLP